MGTVAFWSPLLGGSGNTAHALTVASMIGLEYRTKLLLGHGGKWEERIEKGIQETTMRLDDRLVTTYKECGMDALERLCLNRRLNKENIRDYTTPLMYGGIDFITGNAKKEGTLPGYRCTLIPSILSMANQYYDLNLMDAGCGCDELDKRGDGAILSSADLIVVSLTQNIQTLEAFFSGSNLPPELQHKPYMLVIGKYDRHSHTTIQHIKRRFGYHGSIHGIPYSTDLLDAWNMRAVLPFMHRSRHKNTHQSAYPFYESIRSLSRDIMNQMNLANTWKDIIKGA
ncbi:hypothetical protein [Paenibacillus sp. CMAA1364]